MPRAGEGCVPDRVETVLLDAGGVLLDLDYAYVRRLLDAKHLHVSAVDLARAEAIARTEVDRHVRDGGRTSEAWRDYFRILLGRVGVPGEYHGEILDCLWEAHQRFGLWTVAVPGALDAVRELRASGFRIGVVSNAEGRVERDLDSAGFAGLLDVVVDSHVVGVEKPDPKIFEIALTRLEAGAGTSVYVGDVPSVDVVGARAAGIAPFLLDRHDLYPEVDAPRLRRIEDLPARLPARDPR